MIAGRIYRAASGHGWVVDVPQTLRYVDTLDAAHEVLDRLLGPHDLDPVIDTYDVVVDVTPTPTPAIDPGGTQGPIQPIQPTTQETR